MKSFTRNVGTGAVVATMLACGASVAVAQDALNIAWVHSNAAAQSEQRVRAGFEEWLAEKDHGWNVSFLDSRGSGEATASNLQDAVARNVDAIIITMSDLRASRAAINVAIEAGIPVFSVDSGFVEGIQVDLTTNNWAMSADVSPYLLDEMGGQGNIIFFRMAEHHGTRKRGDVMAQVLQEYGDVNVLAEHNIDYTAFFEDTVSTMQDYVARFGEDIHAVWAPWDEPAQATINVMRAAGLSDVKVIGVRRRMIWNRWHDFGLEGFHIGAGGIKRYFYKTPRPQLSCRLRGCHRLADPAEDDHFREATARGVQREDIHLSQR